MSISRDGRNFTGNFVIDEKILKEEGVTDFAPYAAVPGTTEFMPDFFLDEFDDYQTKTSPEEMLANQKKTVTKAGQVQAIFDQLSGLINAELVAKIQAIYAFDIKGYFYFSTLALVVITWFVFYVLYF